MEIIKKNPWIVGIILGLVLGFVLTAFLYKYFSLDIFEFSISNFIIVSAVIICFIIVKFIFDAGLKSDKKSTHSFGLPAGTIRATLALVLIVFFVLFSLYSLIVVDDENQRLVSNILTTLATLVISAVSFYFGVKATEQGSEIAAKIWNRGKDPNQNIDEKIILEAIKLNKDTWIKEYNCDEIKLGKKKSNDVQFDLNCITFFVANKNSIPVGGKVIPQMIDFLFNNETFSIPTDVQPSSALQNPHNTAISDSNPFVTLDPDAQKGLIRDFIRINASDLIKKYPEIQGITDFKKISGDIQKEYYAIQFKIVLKDPNISSANLIPKSFEFDNGSGKKYTIPTDIMEVGLVEEAIWRGQNENIKSLGLSISRSDSLNTGSIGLKVNWKGKNYLMTSCHVLFNDEINANPEMTSFITSEVDVVSPGKFDNEEGKGLQVIGKLKYGWYDSFLDIAFAELVDESKLKNIPYLKTFELEGIKEINSEEDNGIKVKLFGRTSHEQEGKIVNYSQKFLNIPGRKRALFELIECDFKSEKGDSGGVVLEKDTNKIIGILVAKSKNGVVSYVISIQKIINLLNLDKSTNSWIS